MIILRVKEVAVAHGIADAAALSRRANIAHDTAYRLWSGQAGGDGKDRRGVGLMTLHRVAQAIGVRMEELYEEVDEEA